MQNQAKPGATLQLRLQRGSKARTVGRETVKQRPERDGARQM
ncbi:hypothetical protein A3768_5511 (plasmid) [Ralstonia solanacearum]|nr:hypothetical protein A3768_5511 [Ralstonia solanacearum]